MAKQKRIASQQSAYDKSQMEIFPSKPKRVEQTDLFPAPTLSEEVIYD